MNKRLKDNHEFGGQSALIYRTDWKTDNVLGGRQYWKKKAVITEKDPGLAIHQWRETEMNIISCVVLWYSVKEQKIHNTLMIYSIISIKQIEGHGESKKAVYIIITILFSYYWH